MPTGIMLTSLFESNREEPCSMYISFMNQDSAALLDPIRTIAARYQQTIHFYLISDEIFKHFPSAWIFKWIMLVLHLLLITVCISRKSCLLI